MNIESLHLEITENSLIDNFKQIKNTLNLCKDMGISFSIDDFGTGFSSLSYLKNLPFNILKIDKTFIDDIENKKDYNIVKSTISIAKSLGLSTIAEGVTTEKQLSILSELDCDAIQGYYYSEPLPKDKVIEYIKTHS